MMRFRKAWSAGALALAALIAVPVAVVMGGGGGTGDGPAVVTRAATALGAGFTYQGRLEEGGRPASGLYDLRFILYDAEAGGAQVGPTVTAEGVAVSDGFFSLELDFGEGVFDGEARWLEVAVREAGTGGVYSVLSPRQPILAVPYALFARAAALALPFAGAGTAVSPTSLFALTQDGSGPGLDVRRSYGGEVEAPAVYGLNGGAGAGVQGESGAAAGSGVRGLATGAGATGVEGAATGAAGVGGRFQGETGLLTLSSGGGPALALGGGALKVSGDPRPAFVQVVATNGDGANLCGGNGTILDSPLLNGLANAIVLVTPVSSQGAEASAAEARAVTVAYSPVSTCAAAAGRWVVFASGPPLAAGESFNILVVNQ